MAKKMRVQGLTEALARLDAVADMGQRQEVSTIMMEAAKMVTDEARDNIRDRDSDPWKPKTIVVSGKSIDVKTGDLLAAVEEKWASKRAGGVTVGGGAVAKIAFNKAPHAWWLEYGFTMPNGASYPPEGFFRKATQAMRRPISAYIKQRMSDLLKLYTGDGTYPGRK